ncbi:MAG: hypothetical protein ACRD0C_09030 [Acidimicrobiia bacterium]
MNPRPGVCEECGVPARERVEGLSGRLVCRKCEQEMLSTTVLTGGDAIEGVAVHRWRQRLRRWREGRP